MLFKIVLVFSATELMIQILGVFVGPDYAHLDWAVNRFPPERYRVKIMCKYLCSHSDQHLNKDEVILIPSYETSSAINELQPGSRCILRFHAVYNPATLDDGLFSLFTTESTSWL